MKGFEIFVLKVFFGIVCMKSIIRKWCGIIIIHKKLKSGWIFVQVRI
jgi:hypothetical protein